jgi:hypothetical protein
MHPSRGKATTRPEARQKLQASNATNTHMFRVILSGQFIKASFSAKWAQKPKKVPLFTFCSVFCILYYTRISILAGNFKNRIGNGAGKQIF